MKFCYYNGIVGRYGWIPPNSILSFVSFCYNIPEGCVHTTDVLRKVLNLSSDNKHKMIKSERRHAV